MVPKGRNIVSSTVNGVKKDPFLESFMQNYTIKTLQNSTINSLIADKQEKLLTKKSKPTKQVKCAYPFNA